MKKLLIFTCLIVLLSGLTQPVLSQGQVYLPASMGMGGASTAISRGVESLFYNPAGISYDGSKYELLFSYYKPFMGMTLNYFDSESGSIKKDSFADVVFGGVFRLMPSINLGFGYRSYGVSLYKENSVFGLVSYNKEMQKNLDLSVGVKFRYNSMSLENNHAFTANPLLNDGTLVTNDINFDFGILVLNKKFMERFRLGFGANIQNLLAPKIGLENVDKDSNRNINLGLLFEKWNDVKGMSEVKLSLDLVHQSTKINNKALGFRIGAEKLFILGEVPVYLRTGTDLESISAFGAGVDLKFSNMNMVIDFCYEKLLEDISSETMGNFMTSFRVKY